MRRLVPGEQRGRPRPRPAPRRVATHVGPKAPQGCRPALRVLGAEGWSPDPAGDPSLCPPSLSCARGNEHCFAVASVKVGRALSDRLAPRPRRAPKMMRGLCPEVREGGRFCGRSK